MIIKNPKRRVRTAIGQEQWFPYYAGFSSDFARALIASSGLTDGAVVMDPWNGSGTTTSCAAAAGYNAFGFDLNPVMVVVAKGKLIPKSEVTSIRPLLEDILEKARFDRREIGSRDPLNVWFTSDVAKSIRRVERAIRGVLVQARSTTPAVQSVTELSSLAAFFYIALFRTVRSLAHRFDGSNPTWVRRPKNPQGRITADFARIRSQFAAYALRMLGSFPEHESELHAGDWNIGIASSEKLPLETETVDLVLCSPPYCTRIDYAISTCIELAVLGFQLEQELPQLRAALIGTPTVHTSTPEPQSAWGETCVKVLERVRTHPSKAAKSYYYKTYAQYFAGMAKSLAEIGRCLKPRGHCAIVVQDSYFKEVRVDLAAIFTEMAVAQHLVTYYKVDFPLSRTFGNINMKSRVYRQDGTGATESVLCFVKKV